MSYNSTSAFHRFHAWASTVSTALLSFLPHSICTSSSDLPFLFNFCQLGMLKNTFPSLDLVSQRITLDSFPSSSSLSSLRSSYLSPYNLASLSLFLGSHLHRSNIFSEHGNLGGVFIKPARKTKVGLMIFGRIVNLCMILIPQVWRPCIPPFF